MKKEAQEEPIVIDTEGTCDEFCEEEELPALKTMIADLFGLGWKTARAFVSGKKTLSSDKEANKRWSVCLDCEYLLKKKRCSQCGCYMKYKIHVLEAECPIGKWGTSNNKP